MLWDEGCPRGLNNCDPLANRVSDNCESFICCGISDPDTREIERDRFRLCFENRDTNTCYDHDEADLTDLVAIMAAALSLGR